jgi:hypothetical protein
LSVDLEKGRRYLESNRLDWQLPIRTRAGSEVVLYNAEGGGDSPVHGAYNGGDGEWVPTRWQLTGHFRPDKKKCALDIINGYSEKEIA